MSPGCNNGRFAVPQYERAEIFKSPEQPLIGANHGRS